MIKLALVYDKPFRVGFVVEGGGRSGGDKLGAVSKIDKLNRVGFVETGWEVEEDPYLYHHEVD